MTNEINDEKILKLRAEVDALPDGERKDACLSAFKIMEEINALPETAKQWLNEAWQK